jgi:hypothetical protein
MGLPRAEQLIFGLNIGRAVKLHRLGRITGAADSNRFVRDAAACGSDSSGMNSDRAFEILLCVTGTILSCLTMIL